MREKTVKRVVVHPKLYMTVGEKTEHVLEGSEVTITEAVADRLGGKVRKPAELRSIDATAGKAEATVEVIDTAADSKTILEEMKKGTEAALAEMQERLTAAEGEAAAAKATPPDVAKALTEMQERLTAAEKETAAAKKESATAKTALTKLKNATAAT